MHDDAAILRNSYTFIERLMVMMTRIEADDHRHKFADHNHPTEDELIELKLTTAISERALKILAN